ncbi:MAG: hypothetical protein JSU87_04695 [Gemmatimonadota bacterium]|nr:MAG: hypothetical protein JSU87_04695 [Gemmatimonadota bacterium]
MAYTYQELHKMTVAQLREVAKGIENDAVRGYTTMHKHELLPALCKVLGLETYEHHDVVGIDKARLKAQIQTLKAQRDAALAAGDREQLLEARHRIKRLKRKLRRSMV